MVLFRLAAGQVEAGVAVGGNGLVDDVLKTMLKDVCGEEVDGVGIPLGRLHRLSAQYSVLSTVQWCRSLLDHVYILTQFDGSLSTFKLTLARATMSY